RTTQRASLTLGALLVAAAFPALATATTGTCTITSVSAHILAGGPGNLDLPPITVAAGVAMPVEFDEASGSFSLSRDVWASMFGSVGAGGPTGFGPNNFLIMAPGTVSGTIVGVGKIGMPLPTEQPTKPDTGDALTLNAVLAPGGAKLDFTSPVFVRVVDGSGADLTFVEVPAGKLTPKGKAYLVNDLDGSVLLVLVGQKSSGIVSSTTGGTLRFTRTKKSVKLAARLHGLDLSGFGASSPVTIAVGPYTVTAPFTKYRARSPGH